MFWSKPCIIKISLSEKIKKIVHSNERFCPFCYLSFDEKIILKNKFFYSIPSVGPLCDFHILIAPYKHTSSLANFIDSSKKMKKLIELIKKYLLAASNILNKISGILIYEHGRTGQSVSHAHLHLCFPFKISEYTEFTKIVKKDLGKESFCRKYRDFSRIPFEMCKSEYMIVGFFLHKYVEIKVWNNVKLPSQYLRKVVASIRHKRNPKIYDWKKYPQIRKVKSMQNRLEFLFFKNFKKSAEN